MVKKMIFILLTIVLLFGLSISITSAIVKKTQETKTIDLSNNIDPTSNYFGQKVDERKVEIVEDIENTISSDYEKVTENDNLILFLKKKTLGICLYDKKAKYAWYSSYNKLNNLNVTDAVQAVIESGVNITVFDTSTLNEVTKYCSIEKDCTITYKYVSNGFVASLNFITLAIKFDIQVTIDKNDLNAEVLLDTLVEEKYQTKAMKVPKEYKLKDVELFPYFGSENYEINGYALIPDGSGALVRFTNIEYDTAYIKKVYGDDQGTLQKAQASYLKNTYDVVMPIYGINHGYNQASFICQITQGAGTAELHSYPYMYSNLGLNRTFFKLIARNKINIDVASSDSGIITIINENVVNNHFSLKYSFLNNENASYSGMSNEYSEDLNLQKNNTSDNKNIKVKLDTLAQDYKKGLFGKKYVEMTSYKQLLEIITDLKNDEINNLSINYIGYNKNGYFDNTLSKIKLDYDLGTKKDYQSLINYLEDNNFEIYYYSNPVIATVNSLVKETIKTLNLKIFEYEFKSSVEQTGKIINPLKLSTYFLNNEKQYQKLSMNNFSFSTLGNLCISYRYKTNEYTRDQMIEQIVSEVEKIKLSNENYNLALENPYSYLYKYVSSIYNTPTASSKYSFFTDSVPFMTLVLSGNVDCYSSNINYVSDYDLFYLRLIEYDVYPSFMITYEDTNLLRYCNYEYLYTTKYKAWESEIKRSYYVINDALKNVIDSKMISHQYLEEGICECIYDNGVKIYVNYTKENYIYQDINIPAGNYYVLGGK